MSDMGNSEPLILLLGQAPRALSPPEGWRLVAVEEVAGDTLAAAAPGSCAVVLADGAEPARLDGLLAGPVGLAAPVIETAESGSQRADVRENGLDSDRLSAALGRVAPIRRRLAELPDVRGDGDATALSVLAYAYAREAPIAPVWDPDHPAGMRFPAFAGLPGARRLLEEMAGDGLLARTHAARLNLCGRCGGSRLNVAEHCPDCGSSHLRDVRLVHHYACGYQAPEDDFGPRGAMTCPKCGRRPRHFGVDYDAPSVVPVCRSCGATADPPAVRFTCMDCGGVTPADGAETIDWFAYRLTDDGIAAVRAGRRPRLELDGLFEPIEQSRPLTDFAHLLQHDLDVAERYERPICLVRARLSDPGTLAGKHGRRAVADALSLLAELLGENLRETDLLTVGTDTVMIAMPETPPNHARPVLDRLNREVVGQVAIDLDFSTEILDRDGAEATLRKLGAYGHPAPAASDSGEAGA